MAGFFGTVLIFVLLITRISQVARIDSGVQIAYAPRRYANIGHKCICLDSMRPTAHPSILCISERYGRLNSVLEHMSILALTHMQDGCMCLCDCCRDSGASDGCQYSTN